MSARGFKVIAQHVLPSVNEASLSALAKKIAAVILGESVVIYLEGDLGAGKTTFSRGFIQALGHQGAVKSPTYTLLEPYLDLQPPVFHFDLYRLADPEELEYIGIRDYLEQAGVFIFEWPSCGQGFIPQPDILLRIQLATEDTRQITVQSHSEKGEALRQKLA